MFTHLRALLLSDTLVRRLVSSLVSAETDPGGKKRTVQDGTIQGLFAKLQMKARRHFIGYTVGEGWVKYEWKNSIWDLDDGLLHFYFAGA